MKLLLLYLLVFHQHQSVQFTFNSERLLHTSGVYVIYINAHIENGWHVYAYDADFPVRIIFKKNNNIIHLKMNEWGCRVPVEDTVFHSKGMGYENNIMFNQKILTKDHNSDKVEGEIVYLSGDGKVIEVNRVPFMIALN